MHSQDESGDIDLMSPDNEYSQPEVSGLSPEITISRLMEENKMKVRALEKASSLIELLNNELEVTKKSYELAIAEMRENENKAEVTWRNEEIRLNQKIKLLEKRNSFLEYELKKKVQTSNQQAAEKRESFLKPKSSMRSLRDSHSEERKVDTSRVIKYIKDSPKVNRLERQDSRMNMSGIGTTSNIISSNNNNSSNSVSMYALYAKKVLNRLVAEESARCSAFEQVVTQEAEELSEAQSKIEILKTEIAEMLAQQAQQNQWVKRIKVLQQANQVLTDLVRQQQEVMTLMKNQETDLKNYLHEFISSCLAPPQNPSNFLVHGPANSIYTNSSTVTVNPNQYSAQISEMERLLALMMRNVKQRFLKKKKEVDQMKNLKLVAMEYQKLMKCYSQLKSMLVGNDREATHEDIVHRIGVLRNRLRVLEDENIELKSIAEGLIKYVKK